MTVERYMALCLAHYYATRDPLGVAGDFTTAPEISQIFGELVGLWAMEVWNAMGRPARLHLVELGPGRGTLMADMLRTARILPDFLAALRVHLVETSPTLRARQQGMLAQSGPEIAWHGDMAELPAGPMILVANEFFDALPVRQFVATERGWCERLVGLAGDRLVFGLASAPEHQQRAARPAGAFLERQDASICLTATIAGRLAREGGAALIIDYGYWGPATADTLQALRHHQPVDPLSDPGEADLTTHVDFAQIAAAGLAAGARLHGLDTQANFLHALGIATRAARLKAAASSEQAKAIEEAVARLTDTGERGMGALFKVLALTHPGLDAVPGLHARPHPPQR
nr:SAM-dependent methyltransferase [Microvirga antarctica]